MYSSTASCSSREPCSISRPSDFSPGNDLPNVFSSSPIPTRRRRLGTMHHLTKNSSGPGTPGDPEGGKPKPSPRATTPRGLLKGATLSQDEVAKPWPTNSPPSPGSRRITWSGPPSAGLGGTLLQRVEHARAGEGPSARHDARYKGFDRDEAWLEWAPSTTPATPRSSARSPPEPAQSSTSATI